ncbi:RibD family protein [Nocardioides terrigena]|uniref:RibD family protein n=1 Tax=Nocardioides terrigena TaxID=424797 RepID=UPI000D307FB1|nr:RibD family protein [Nocardioides terrigena]
MAERPYTILSCSVSLDGYLGGATPERLVLSNEADLHRVDHVRAGCDAIMVGAATVRADNPRLLVRDPRLRLQRRSLGLEETPTKVTVTEHARLDACSNFFAAGDGEKIVYCASRSVPAARRRLAAVATVVDGGEPVEVPRLTEDLYARGVRRLMVEGGGRVHTQFLTTGIADELHLVVAPFFVGSSHARRFVGDGDFPWNPAHRARLVETCQIGDVVLLRYALSARFEGPS